MKGYKAYNGKDYSPCFFCKHRRTSSAFLPCADCMDNSQLALHMPSDECDFASFEPISEFHLKVLEYEQGEQKR